MTTYAVFLRGINVGGIKVLKSDLLKCFEKIGMSETKTYLQTGSVTLCSDKLVEQLKQMVETALFKTFSYDAHVLIYEQSELQTIISSYPFTHADTSNHRYAVLCQDFETIKELMAHKDNLNPEIEKIATGPSTLYWQVKKV